jgi:hypothetical protein
MFKVNPLNVVQKNFGFDFTTAQTDTVIWTPATGLRFYITSIFLRFGATSGTGELTLFDGTNSAANWIVRVTNGVESDQLFMGYPVPRPSMSINTALKLTTTIGTGQFHTVLVTGYEAT